MARNSIWTFSGIPENVEVTLDAWLTTKAIFDEGVLPAAATDPKPTDAQNEIMGISPTTVEFDTRMVTVTLMGTRNWMAHGVQIPSDDTTTAVGTAATMLSSDSVDVIIIQGSIRSWERCPKSSLAPADPGYPGDRGSRGDRRRR